MIKAVLLTDNTLVFTIYRPRASLTQHTHLTLTSPHPTPLMSTPSSFIFKVDSAPALVDAAPLLLQAHVQATTQPPACFPLASAPASLLLVIDFPSSSAVVAGSPPELSSCIASSLRSFAVLETSTETS